MTDREHRDHEHLALGFADVLRDDRCALGRRAQGGPLGVPSRGPRGGWARGAERISKGFVQKLVRPTPTKKDVESQFHDH
jgi:hypothetical protein